MSKPATIHGIIKGARAYLPEINEERIFMAYEYAKRAHDGQVRSSGDPYIQHPLEATKILLELKPDETTIIACLLHDVLEDTDMSSEELEKAFGPNVLLLLKGMEKLSTVYYRGKERQVENLRKMFLAMAKDIRVILIKLCDRLHNMKTLQYIPEHKRERIAQETLTVYAPIASRLGIYRIKNELEDLCFKFLYQEEYDRLNDELSNDLGVKKGIIDSSKKILKKTINKADIDGDVEGRVKHVYSIFKKLKRKGKNYAAELYDIFALRIIVDTEEQCYQTLGIIHKNWKPLTRRFKDYIAVAKTNGYQSLHTTLIGLCPDIHQQPIEIQIRSREMDEIAKFGIAAHWHYKEEDGMSIVLDQNKLSWVQNLVNLHESLKSNSEFIESLNVDVFQDRIFILTPKGDVFDLPTGSTAIDFAYAIHTDIGHKCKGAKMNDKIVSLDQPLENGKIVEILTRNQPNPNRYWLSFIKTSHAKNRIKQWFAAQGSDDMVKVGKDMINNHLKRYNQPPLSPDLNILANYSEKKLNMKQREALLEKVGNGSVDVISVIKAVLPLDKIMKKTTEKNMAKDILTEGVKFDEDSEVLITGEKGYQTQIATCCMPKPNDDITGYITKGRGVTIHKSDCKTIQGLDQKRFIKVSWSTQTTNEYEVKLLLRRQSRIGLLRDVAAVFADNELPIIDLENRRTAGTDVGEMIITANFDGLDTLNSIIEKLEQIPGVFGVKEID